MRTNEAMPVEAVARVLLEVRPCAPAPEAAERIRRRVLKRVADEPRPAAAMVDIRRADGWRAFDDKAQMKVLHDDGSTMTWLVRMQAGAVLAAHEHEGTEECLVLEGDVWLNDVRYGPGDYQIAFAGSRHHSTRSESGCLLFVRSPSPPTMCAMLS